MKENNPVENRKRKFGYKKVAVISLSAIVLILFAAQVTWKYSGNNQWTKMYEQNGVTLYSLKAPGTDLMKFKGITRLNESMSTVISFMQDPEACDELGCTNSHAVEIVNSQLQYYSFRFELPVPFLPREYVMSSLYFYDPVTHEVRIHNTAKPGKTPVNDCCFRVSDLNNSWRLTPLESGDIEVEFIMDMDEGGFFPDFLVNLAYPDVVYDTLFKLPGYVSKDKYRTATVDFISDSNKASLISDDSSLVTR